MLVSSFCALFIQNIIILLIHPSDGHPRGKGGAGRAGGSVANKAFVGEKLMQYLSMDRVARKQTIRMEINKIS
jgi:hypothetical protein